MPAIPHTVQVNWNAPDTVIDVSIDRTGVPATQLVVPNGALAGVSRGISIQLN